MNTQNFNQLGGFPFETDNLEWMQEAYSIFNALGDVIGNYTILSGCNVTGGNVSDGVVFVNGEVYAFKGGAAQTNVRILQTATEKVFENGESKQVHFERYVTFASGTGAIPWANFKRPSTLINLSSRILPAGTNPQLFSGNVASLPEGWNFCDGGTYNGIVTPDLRSRFIVGYDNRDSDYSLIGLTGGEKEVELTVDEMPSHDHSGTTSTNGAHTHLSPAENSNSGSDVHFRIEAYNRAKQAGESAGNHSHSLNINNTGGGNAHENRPPYYTLAYIIYTG